MELEAKLLTAISYGIKAFDANRPRKFEEGFGIGVSTVTLFFIRRLGTTKNNFDFNRGCSVALYHTSTYILTYG